MLFPIISPSRFTEDSVAAGVGATNASIAVRTRHLRESTSTGSIPEYNSSLRVQVRDVFSPCNDDTPFVLRRLRYSKLAEYYLSDLRETVPQATNSRRCVSALAWQCSAVPNQLPNRKWGHAKCGAQSDSDVTSHRYVQGIRSFAQKRTALPMLFPSQRSWRGSFLRYSHALIALFAKHISSNIGQASSRYSICVAAEMHGRPENCCRECA